MVSRPPPDPSFILRGTKSAVTSLAFQSKDCLFSGDQDGRVHQWSLFNRRIKATLDAHSDHTVLWVCPQSEDRLLTQGRDGLVKQWQNTEGAWENIAHVRCASLGFCACGEVRLNNSSLVAAPSEVTSQVDLFSMDKQRHVMSLKPDANQQRIGMCMSIKPFNSQSETDSQLLVGYENGSIHLWDLRNIQSVSVLDGLHSESVMCMDFSAALMKGFSGSVDTKLVSWTVHPEKGFTKSLETVFTNPGLNDVLVRQDSKLVATAGWDTNIRLFGCKKMKPLAVLSYHRQSAQCLAFSPDNLLACGSKDQLISMWDIYR